ncbi:Mth938-like domain-containing protein [Methanopyrus sp.]
MFGGTGFGWVEYGGERYNYDVYVTTEGKVHRREKGLSRSKFGTSHNLAADELRRLLELCDEEPEIIVVGTGQSGVLSVTDEAREFCEERGMELVEAPTPEAIERYNELKDEGKKVAAVIHTTC